MGCQTLHNVIASIIYKVSFIAQNTVIYVKHIVIYVKHAMIAIKQVFVSISNIIICVNHDMLNNLVTVKEGVHMVHGP